VGAVSVMIIVSAPSNRVLLLSSALMTLTIGVACWIETRESLVMFFTFTLLFVDMVLISFSPMLKRKNVKDNLLENSVKKLKFSYLIWFLVMGYLMALWMVWTGDFGAVLHPVSRVFSQTVFLEFWVNAWPIVMISGVFVLGVGVSAMLLVKGARKE
jgi:hypothetical protein